MSQFNSSHLPNRHYLIGDIQVSGNKNIVTPVQGDNNTLHFFSYEITPHGGVVNILPPEQSPKITAIKPPVSLRPRPFPNLLGREAEIQKTVTALETSQAVELYGTTGVGKSVLLRHIAHHPISKSLELFPDGVVYFYLAWQEPVEDLQQKLFETFYISDRPFKPSAVRIRHDLHDKKALILLDNASLSRQDVEKLWEIMPNCVFLFSSSERNLWGEGQPIQIGGISQDIALLLIEQELGQSLTSQDRAAAEAICNSLNGHPLEILQQIASMRENKEWLADVASRIRSNPSREERTRYLLRSLGSPQRTILAALAALGGIALSAQQVSAIANVQSAESFLNELQEKRLCKLELRQSGDSRHILSSNLLEPIQKQENLTPYLERAVSFFTSWIPQANPEDLQREAEAISYVLNWSVKQGRWNDVLLLGKPFESALALLGQWELQAQVLRWYEQAAENWGDKSAITWATHQMGVRALSLGYAATA